MIFYILFAKFEDELPTILENSELIKNLTLNENIDPNMLYGMAKALISIGTELQGGKLKTLDLKNYSIITKTNQDHILVLVVDNSKRSKVKRRILIEKLVEIFEIFKIYNKKNKITQEYLDDLKKALQNLIPTCKKSIKNLKIKKK